MSRTIIAIGCNQYEHLDALEGAETDAKRLFDVLVKPEIGDYDQTSSRLLLSPTHDQVRDAIKTILFGDRPPETLTFTFAGHGAVSAGSFYMATRDSRPDALSATAFALADLFRMIAEAAPKQTYIIIDACESGGLTADLNVILKSDLIGKLGTPGISLLATAASDEWACEDDNGGFGTSAVLACINGDVMLQDTSAVLDLVEIGRAVSTRVSEQGGQTPVVWGLNLYGPPSFCKNPHVGTGNAPLKSLLAAWPQPESAEEIRAIIPDLWEPYVTIPKKWNARVFVNQLTPAFASLKDTPSALSIFARRVADDFGAQATTSNDRFREIEVRAACAVALLPYSERKEISEEIGAMGIGIANLAKHALAGIASSIDDYQYALTNDGLFDLYQLPIKLTRLFGWAGYVFHTFDAVGEDTSSTKALIANLAKSLFKIYSLSLVSMNDEQAAHAALALTALASCGLNDEGERLIGHLFSSVVACGGRLASRNIESDAILTYLVARDNNSLGERLNLVAQPTEHVAVLLRAARLFGLTDEFNGSLIHLDHLSLNAYLPDSYLGFGSHTIEGGVNATFQIGHEIWTVEDVENAWPEFAKPATSAESMAAMLSSLIFRDRVAWFLFPPHGTQSTPNSNSPAPTTSPASSSNSIG